MTRIAQCASPAAARQNIDPIDRQLVAPIAGRLAWAAMHPPSPQAN